MTTFRRTTNNSPSSTSRSESVRTRRKNQEVKKLWSGARAVSHNRAAVDRNARSATPNWKRHTATITGTTRRWNATAAPALRGGAMRSLAAVMPQIEPSWRWASGAIVMVLAAVLFHMISSPRYFVNSINLSGALNIPGEEVYEASGVDNLNIFWISRATIQENVDKVPGIKSAEVEIRWPNLVYIAVVENEPVLAWSQAGQTMWVDREGVVFPMRSDIPGLLPIVVDDASYALMPESRLPTEVIEGALQLKQLRNNIELLHYDSVNGLSYQDGRNWRGYFGVGTEMETKIVVYETLINNLLSRGITPSVVNVVNADAPYYRR